MTGDPTTEHAIQAAMLAEISHSAKRLLSEMNTPPRSLRVRTGDVAVDIEWPGPRPNGTRARTVSTADSGMAVPPPGRPERDARRPVLTAQAVGVFYRCPEPGADPFVQVGDVVAVGQQVAIVEAMKLMLPVEAERAGRIVEVLKDDGEQVERGEPVFALAETD